MIRPIRTKLIVLAVALACLVLGAVFASTIDPPSPSLAQNGSSTASQSTLRTIGNAFTQIAQEVTPAVVSVQSDRVISRRSLQDFDFGPFEDFFDFESPQAPQEPQPVQGSGSGVIVRPDGYIATNNHVVQGAQRVRVVLNDGRTFDAQVVGRDPSTDIAVLKIEADGLPVARLAADGDVQVGEWVLAFGNPFGLDFTMTAGIVSAMGRGNLPLPRETNYAIQDFIQTDAAINPGNSGGPLVNIDGDVVGINTAIASRTGAYQGYGFAIPVAIVRRVMDELIETGEVRRAVLGVSIQPVTPLDAEALDLPRVAGVLVADYDDSVQPNPARRAGLQPGDVVLEVDGRQVDTVSALQQAVAFHDPGDTVELTVWRDGDDRKIEVQLGERPRIEEAELAGGEPARGEEVHESALGLEVQEVTPQVRQAVARQFNIQPNQVPAGVLVREVEPLSAASDARLRRGFIITQVAERPVRNLGEYRDAINDLDEGDVAFLRAYDPSADTQGFFAIRVPR
ncbi:MAG: Do family serine endopeptidase [Gemmatimonadota bacterium]